MKDKQQEMKKTEEENSSVSRRRSADVFSGVVIPKGALQQSRKRKRSPKEEQALREQIEEYQHYKKLCRSVAITAILTILVCIVLAYKIIVRPPEIARFSASPEITNTPAVSSGSVNSGQPTQDIDESPEPTEAVVKKERLDNVYNILLVGREQSYGNTDTIMLCRFDAENGEVRILSIPRDTCANVESNTALSETKKINSIFARDEIEGLMNAVSDIVGCPVDNYIMVGINAFVRLVDTIGGVSFDVPYNMNYDDPTQNLHIHFKAGYQYLTGSDAIKVVRWRQNNDGSSYGDIVRIQTQQDFLKTVLKQCLSISNIASNLKNYVKIFEENVKTDMTNGNLLWFAQQFLKIGTDNLSFFTLPSKSSDNIGGFAYGTILLDDWLAMLNENFNAYNVPLTSKDINVIYRDASGNLVATSGEIAGGMDSFLNYQEYLKRLEEWNKSKQTAEPQPTERPPVETNPPEETDTPTVTPQPTTPQPTATPRRTAPPTESGQPTESESPTESGQPTESEPPVETAEPTPTAYVSPGNLSF